LKVRVGKEIEDDEVKCPREDPPHQNRILYTRVISIKIRIHSTTRQMHFARSHERLHLISKKSKQPNNHMSKGPRAAKISGE
jgi:hypothetical protein